MTWRLMYRTRLAIDDRGELIVLAPYVETFGKDERIDDLIHSVEASTIIPSYPTARMTLYPEILIKL